MTTQVLIETYVEGIKLTDLLALVAETNADPTRVSPLHESLLHAIPEAGIKTFFSMIFKHHVVHADLHPGYSSANYLIVLYKLVCSYSIFKET